jgi:hypothetical protein
MSRITITVALLFLLLFSCEKGYVTDCRECQPDAVGSVTLKIYARNPDYIPVNPILTLYDGPMEDNIILLRLTLQEPYAVTTYNALLYKDYTATIEFYLNNKHYILTDAACPQVRYDETSCSEPCYYVYNNVIDLRLRYQ